MKVGLFCPIGNNGWLMSENAPQYSPSFELNKHLVLRAEHYNFDFALSMIKLRGFGGKTQFWEENLESFTLMAGLAAVTKRIQIFATAPTLLIPPAIVARMASTIDSISNGRFGVNVVAGWQAPEYSQMGMWPGDDYFATRYDTLSEYVHIMRELWETGQSDFKGQYFQMEDCRVLPRPKAPMKIISAGQSNDGMAFCAKYADYNFAFAKGINTPKAFADVNSRLKHYTDQTGRDVKTCLLMMIIAAPTDEEAFARWEHLNAGLDVEAVNNMVGQTTRDTKSGTDTNVRQMASSVSPININMGTFIGSYANIAKMLDEVSEVEGTEGVLLTFDDFVQGIEDFGTHIQPLMKCRQDVLQQAC